MISIEHTTNKLRELSGFWTFQGGHSPGKPGKVREFESGQGKVREKRKSQGKCVLACGQLPRVLFLTQKMQER